MKQRGPDEVEPLRALRLSGTGRSRYLLWRESPSLKDVLTCWSASAVLRSLTLIESWSRPVTIDIDDESDTCICLSHTRIVICS